MSEMSDSSNAQARRQELLADAAMDELDPAETAELGDAQASNPFAEVVATLTQALVPAVAMPQELAKRIENHSPAYVSKPPAAQQQEAAPMRLGAWSGWIVAAAACLALLLTQLPNRQPPPVVSVQPGVQREPPVVSAQPGAVQREPAKPPQPTPAELRQQLIDAPGAMQVAFAGVKDTAASGDVVWSDKDQRGFMRFANLPANDPSQFQYQLWIFDETGDMNYPIDGGVFNVSAGGEQIVAIDPKIKVGKAVMFAVTRERPGGVVVSKREYIAVLAKPA